MRIFALPVAFGLLSACGGTVGADSTSRTGGGSSGGSNAVPGSGGAPFDGGTLGIGGRASRPEAGLSDARYVDPGCPPPMHVQGVHECDPYHVPGGCSSGEKCSPYVTYADRCRSEETGTRCVMAGVGLQGDDCANDACAEGFVCVSAGTGFQCAHLCQLSGATDDCPPGLICSPLDVDGFYVCG